MENNENIIKPVEGMRKCRSCGKLLPISMFDRFGKRGFHTSCKKCEGKDIGEDPRFVNIESRDLILELRARGYKGKLQLIKVEDVVI